ncbi:hypothetical protein M3Y97_01051900 [Aphelenchoides bicaudatus]|nr:hypothetical protein M3Y97_01051900 [Aphelenchoides bicaudatus]
MPFNTQCLWTRMTKQLLSFLTRNIPDDTVYAQSSGKLTFGDNPDVCKNWRSAPDDTSDTYTWTLKFDKITVGGDLLVNKPIQVGTIAFDSTVFRFPTAIYNSLTKMMKVDTDDNVSCDIKKNITYHMNGFKIDIMPADYLIGKHLRYKNRCIFLGYDGGSKVDYTFPVQIFDRYCARFDYGKKQIGFADRTDFTGKKGFSSSKSILSIWTVLLINYALFM